MIDCTVNERKILNSPIISMITLVFRSERFWLNPFETGSLIIVAEVSKAVEPEDITAESKAAINNPTPHSGKVLSITGISAEPFC